MVDTVSARAKRVARQKRVVKTFVDNDGGVATLDTSLIFSKTQMGLACGASLLAGLIIADLTNLDIVNKKKGQNGDLSKEDEEKLQEQLKSLNADLQEAKNELTRDVALLSSKANELSEANLNLATTRARVKELEAQVNSLNSRLSEFNALNDKYNNLLSSSKGLIGHTADSDVKALNDKIDALSKENGELKSGTKELSDLQAKIKSVQSELDALRKTHGLHSDEEYASLMSEKEQLEKDLEAAAEEGPVANYGKDNLALFYDGFVTGNPTKMLAAFDLNDNEVTTFIGDRGYQIAAYNEFIVNKDNDHEKMFLRWQRVLGQPRNFTVDNQTVKETIYIACGYDIGPKGERASNDQMLIDIRAKNNKNYLNRFIQGNVGILGQANKTTDPKEIEILKLAYAASMILAISSYRLGGSNEEKSLALHTALAKTFGGQGAYTLTDPVSAPYPAVAVRKAIAAAASVGAWCPLITEMMIEEFKPREDA